MLQKTLTATARVAGFGASAVLIGIGGLIMYEVILRTFLARSSYMVEEVVGYGMATLCFLALGDSLNRGTLMRVNLLFAWVSRWPAARRGVELVCCASALAVLAVPIWFFWFSVSRNYRDGFRSGTMADVPAWMPEALFLFGMVLFWLQLALYTVQVAAGKRDLAAPTDDDASHLE